jgi:hypothetical protein
MLAQCPENKLDDDSIYLVPAFGFHQGLENEVNERKNR